MDEKIKEVTNVFVEQAKAIAEDWTREYLDDGDTHPKYSDKMYLLHETGLEVIKAMKEEKEEEKEAVKN